MCPVVMRVKDAAAVPEAGVSVCRAQHSMLSWGC